MRYNKGYSSTTYCAFMQYKYCRIACCSTLYIHCSTLSTMRSRYLKIRSVQTMSSIAKVNWWHTSKKCVVWTCSVLFQINESACSGSGFWTLAAKFSKLHAGVGVMIGIRYPAAGALSFLFKIIKKKVDTSLCFWYVLLHVSFSSFFFFALFVKRRESEN